jgi:hypothetical protein
MLLKPFVAVGSTRPAYEVADVFRQYGAAYQREHRVTWQQHKVMRDIVQCRTAALGGFVVSSAERLCRAMSGVRAVAHQLRAV